jgi:urate oxidase
MKNTVYWLARESQASTLEEYAIELVEYLLANNAQVTKASAEVDEKSWERVLVDDKPHGTTYRLAGPELQTAEVSRERGGSLEIRSGIDGLVILKTTKSAFTGYIKDKLTTLPESTDRIFGTRATAVWDFSKPPESYEVARASALGALVKTFAEHDSLSVQHTLYDMGEAMLAAVPGMARVTLTMPNLHCHLVDLSRFGQENPNQIFVPTDEPHGYIEATITR